MFKLARCLNRSLKPASVSYLLLFPGVPQLVVLTKVDDSCPLVKENLTNIYRSVYIKEIVSVCTQVNVSSDYLF